MMRYVRFYKGATTCSVVEQAKADEFDTGLMVEPSGGGDAIQEQEEAAAARSVVEQSQADEFDTGPMVEPSGGGDAVQEQEEAAARSVVEQSKADEFDTGLMVEPSGGADTVQEEVAAHSVVEQLKADGFDTVLMVEPSGGADAVQKAIDDEFLDTSLRALATKQLAEGHYMVSVQADFGLGKRAVDILEAGNPIPVDTFVRVSPRNSSPLSDLLGIGTLSPGKPDATLLDNSWAPTGFLPLLSRPKSGRQSAMGMPLLSTPKSGRQSAMGMPLLTKSSTGKTRSFGFKMLSADPAPLSFFLGLPLFVDTSVRVSPRNPSPWSDFLGIGTLSPSRSYTTLLDNSTTLTGFVPLLSRPKSGRKSAMGMPLLNTPKSGRKSAMGMPLLTKSSTGKTRSFGFKMLSADPAPLSSFLGLPLFVDTLSSAVARTEKSRRQLNKDWTTTGFIPLLSRPKSGRKSAMGMPLLSTPKSGRKSALGMPLLTKSSTGKTRSFGFEMLSADPAPLSSFFGLPLLLDTWSSSVARTERSRRQPRKGWTTTGFIPLLSRPS